MNFLKNKFVKIVSLPLLFLTLFGSFNFLSTTVDAADSTFDSPPKWLEFVIEDCRSEDGVVGCDKIDACIESKDHYSSACFAFKEDYFPSLGGAFSPPDLPGYTWMLVIQKQCALDSSSEVCSSILECQDKKECDKVYSSSEYTKMMCENGTLLDANNNNCFSILQQLNRECSSDGNSSSSCYTLDSLLSCYSIQSPNGSDILYNIKGDDWSEGGWGGVIGTGNDEPHIYWAYEAGGEEDYRENDLQKARNIVQESIDDDGDLKIIGWVSANISPGKGVDAGTNDQALKLKACSGAYDKLKYNVDYVKQYDDFSDAFFRQSQLASRIYYNNNLRDNDNDTNASIAARQCYSKLNIPVNDAGYFTDSGSNYFWDPSIGRAKVGSVSEVIDKFDNHCALMSVTEAAFGTYPNSGYSFTASDAEAVERMTDYINDTPGYSDIYKTGEELIEETEKAQVKSEEQGNVTNHNAAPEAEEECKHWWDLGCQLKKFGLWLFESLMNFVLFLFLLILWLFFFVVNLIADVIFFFIASVADYLLLLNPASDAYIDISKSLFSVMVSLGNLLILFMFLYAGLSKIWGFGSKKPISDFFTNIAIIAVLINFSFYAVAGVISLSYRVGYMFYDGMRGAADTIEDNANNPFIDLKNKIAKVQENPEAETVDGEGNKKGSVFDVDFFAKEPLYILILPAFMKTLSITIVLIMGIIAMIGLLRYLMVRLVIMFFLLITAPVGLVLYFSSYDRFKQYGDKWVELLFTTAMTYPFIIITISLGATLVDKVAEVMGNNKVISDPGSAELNGQTVSMSWLPEIAPVVIPALIAVAVLIAIRKFVDQQMSGIAGQMYNAGAGALGKTMKGVSWFYRKGGKFAGRTALGAYGAGKGLATGGARGLKGGFKDAFSSSAFKDVKTSSGLWNKTKALGSGVAKFSGVSGLASGAWGATKGAASGAFVEGYLNRSANKGIASFQGMTARLGGRAERFIRESMGDDQSAINSADKFFGEKSVYKRLGSSAMEEMTEADKKEAERTKASFARMDYYDLKPTEKNMVPRIDTLSNRLKEIKAKKGKVSLSDLSDKEIQDVRDFIDVDDPAVKMKGSKINDIIGTAEFQNWLKNNDSDRFKKMQETMPTFISKDLENGEVRKNALANAIAKGNIEGQERSVLMSNFDDLGDLLDVASDPNDLIRVNDAQNTLLNKDTYENIKEVVKNTDEKHRGDVKELGVSLMRDLGFSAKDLNNAFKKYTKERPNNKDLKISDVLKSEGVFEKTFNAKFDGDKSKFKIKGSDLDGQVKSIIGSKELLDKVKPKYKSQAEQAVKAAKSQNPEISKEEIESVSQEAIATAMQNSDEGEKKAIINTIEATINGMAESADVEGFLQNQYNQVEKERASLSYQQEMVDTLGEIKKGLLAQNANMNRQDIRNSKNLSETKENTKKSITDLLGK